MKNAKIAIFALLLIAIVISLVSLPITGKTSPARIAQAFLKPRPTQIPMNEDLPLIRLMFVGDINLGRCVAKEAILSADFTYPFHYVAEKLSAADIAIGSLDSTVSDQSDPEPCPSSMNLIGPENMALGLEYAGFDVITTATNHIKDCGELGFRCNNMALFDTLTVLRSHGIQPTGAGRDVYEARKPAIIEVKGIRFAFLGINQIDERVWATPNEAGTAPLSEEWIAQVKMDIRDAKRQADVVVVLPQWGIEYAPQPEPYQRDWAREFINAGATLVVGNHPHIIQPVEEFENGAVFYALGNFVFDQKQDYRREGVVLETSFRGSQLLSWKLHPISIDYFTYQPSWVSGDYAKEILQRASILK